MTIDLNKHTRISVLPITLFALLWIVCSTATVLGETISLKDGLIEVSIDKDAQGKPINLVVREMKPLGVSHNILLVKNGSDIIYSDSQSEVKGREFIIWTQRFPIDNINFSNALRKDIQIVRGFNQDKILQLDKKTVQKLCLDSGEPQSQRKSPLSSQVASPRSDVQLAKDGKPIPVRPENRTDYREVGYLLKTVESKIVTLPKGTKVMIKREPAGFIGIPLDGNSVLILREGDVTSSLNVAENAKDDVIDNLHVRLFGIGSLLVGCKTTIAQNEIELEKTNKLLALQLGVQERAAQERLRVSYQSFIDRDKARYPNVKRMLDNLLSENNLPLPEYLKPYYE